MKNRNRLLEIFLCSLFFSNSALANTIDETVDGMYKAVSFERNQRPQFEDMRKVFTKDAVLIDNTGDKPAIYSIDNFIKAVTEQWNTGIDLVKKQPGKGTAPTFQEKEIYSATDVFGNVAQRLSTYKASFEPENPKATTYGVNFIQLVKIGGDWKVSSLIWNNETDKLKIPAKYLPH